MSLDKAINSGKEHRKPYKGGKAIDPGCRNNNKCPYCTNNRQHNTKKRLLKSQYGES